MSAREVRRDPTTGLWSIIATDRVARPMHLEPRRTPDTPAQGCPFCPGNESAIEPPIDAIERKGGWTVRAVPNKFPALSVGLEWSSRAYGPYDRLQGVGAHEVIVEGRDHDRPLYEQPAEITLHALTMVRRRMRDLHGDFRLRYLAWFRNHGQECGASQAHPHAQLLGLPQVPLLIQEMVRRARHHRADRGRDLLQDLVDHDLDAGDRVVWHDDEVVALCPWAPRAPFETWIVPVGPATRFREATDAQLQAVARVMHRVTGTIARELEDPPHHVVLYDAPRNLDDRSGFRWHFRIRPRLEPGGGFEAGFGGAIVGVPPEESARVIRGG